MMRFLTLFVVLLFVIQRTFADNCQCRCCGSNGFPPQVVDNHYLWFCSSATCSPDKCIQWNYDKCPPAGAFGTTEAECRDVSGSERLLSSLFIVFGITSITLMIKNKF